MNSICYGFEYCDNHKNVCPLIFLLIYRQLQGQVISASSTLLHKALLEMTFLRVLDIRMTTLQLHTKFYNHTTKAALKIA